MRARALTCGLALLASPLQPAEFIVDERPARSLALGGPSLALPDGPAALSDNLAGLGDGASELWARWQGFGTGGDGPDLGQGALSLRWGPRAGLGLGLLWQHQASPALARDRIRLGLGADLGTLGLPGLSLGLGLDRLRQEYTLDPAFTYAGLPSRESQAYDLAAGLRMQPWGWLALGVAGEQLTRPNLGLWGSEIFEPVWHWDLALTLPLGAAGSLRLQGGQDLDGQALARGGVEWRSRGEVLALRAGASSTRASAGAGFRVGALRLDYAYRLGLGAEAQAFGASHGVDLGLAFSARLPAPTPTPTAPPALEATEMPPALQATPTPDPLDARVAQALALWQDGKRQRAIELLEDGLRQRPERATEAALLQAWRRSQATPTPAPTPRPETERLLREAQVYRLQGRRDLSRAALEQARDLAPADAEIRRQLKELERKPVPRPARERSQARAQTGLRLHAQGDTLGARKAWEKALELDPDNLDALNSLTRLRLQGAKDKP